MDFTARDGRAPPAPATVQNVQTVQTGPDGIPVGGDGLANGAPRLDGWDGFWAWDRPGANGTARLWPRWWCGIASPWPPGGARLSASPQFTSVFRTNAAYQVT